MKKRDYPVTRNHVTWEGVSACIFFYDHREKSNGLFPLKIRLTHKGERVYYRTGFSMSVEDWKGFDNGRKEIKKCRDAIHLQMKRMEAEVEKLFRANEFSFSSLSKKLGKAGGDDDVFSAFDERISKLKAAGRIGNAVVYECALSSFKAYTGATKLSFSRVNKTWVEKYDAKMIEEGKSASTRSMYLRTLRAIIRASDHASPFGGDKGFKVQSGSGRKIALTKSQMNDILMKLPVTAGSTTEKMRDLFYFSYLANGINIRDIVSLKWTNIVDRVIFYERAKTARTNAGERIITIPVLDRMQVIIERWGKPESDYVFGFLEGKPTAATVYTVTKGLTKMMNKHLKKLTKNSGLPPVTTYTARHTFASVHVKNNTPLVMISRSLGHSRLTTTQAYIADFNDDDVRRANEGL